MIEDTDTHNAVVAEFNCNPALMVQEILRLRATIARVEALPCYEICDEMGLPESTIIHKQDLDHALESPTTGVS